MQFSFADGTAAELKGGTLYVNDINGSVNSPVGTFVYQNTITDTIDICLSLGKTYNYTYVKCIGREVSYVYQSKITTSPNACKQQIKLILTLCNNARKICDLNDTLSEIYGNYRDAYFNLQRFVDDCLQQEI